MSYILSALTKAEQSRHGDKPGAEREGAADSGRLLPASAPPGTPTAPHSRWWQGIAVLGSGLALIILAVMAVSSLRPDHKPTPESVANASADSSLPPVVPAEPETAPQNPAASKQQVVVEQVTARESPPSRGSNNPMQMPAEPPPATDIQFSGSLPVLNITGYIYFENNPVASKLFVDGIVHRIGSSPGEGVIIREFRRDRVVISHRSAIHELPVP